MISKLTRLFKDEEGQGMTEYGLIIALVAIVVIGALVALSGSLNTIFGKASTELNTTH